MTAPLIYISGPITSDPWGRVRKALLDDFMALVKELIA